MAWLLGVFDACARHRCCSCCSRALLAAGGLLALLCAAATRLGWRVALALLIVLTPQWLLYQGEVWKDVLFADAAIAGLPRWPGMRGGRMAWRDPGAAAAGFWRPRRTAERCGACCRWRPSTLALIRQGTLAVAPGAFWPAGPDAWCRG